MGRRTVPIHLRLVDTSSEYSLLLDLVAEQRTGLLSERDSSDQVNNT